MPDLLGRGGVADVPLGAIGGDDRVPLGIGEQEPGDAARLVGVVFLEDLVGTRHPGEVELHVHELPTQDRGHVLAGEEAFELVAPAARRRAEMEEDELVLARRLRQAVFERLRRGDLRGRPRLQESFHLGRVVAGAAFEGVGPLGGDDATVAIEHGQERIANPLLEFLGAERSLALAQESIGIRRLDVDHGEHVLVGEQGVDRRVGGEEAVEPVTPTARIESEHHQDPASVPASVPASQGGCGLDLRLGVGLGIINRGASRLLLGVRGLLGGGEGGDRQEKRGGDERSSDPRHGEGLLGEMVETAANLPVRESSLNEILRPGLDISPPTHHAGRSNPAATRSRPPTNFCQPYPAPW